MSRRMKHQNERSTRGEKLQPRWIPIFVLISVGTGDHRRVNYAPRSIFARFLATGEDRKSKRNSEDSKRTRRNKKCGEGSRILESIHLASFTLVAQTSSSASKYTLSACINTFLQTLVYVHFRVQIAVERTILVISLPMMHLA